MFVLRKKHKNHFVTSIILLLPYLPKLFQTNKVDASVPTSFLAIENISRYAQMELLRNQHKLPHGMTPMSFTQKIAH